MFKVGQFKITRQPSQLIARTAKPDEKLVFGIIADIKENTPENLVNLKAILEHFVQ